MSIFCMKYVPLAVAALLAVSGVQAQGLPSGGVPVGTQGVPSLSGLPAGAVPGPSTQQPQMPVAQAVPALNPQASGGGQSPQSLPPLPGGVQVAPNFDDVLSQTLGLTPDQIRQLRRAQVERQRAASELPVKAPKMVLGSVKASPAPGSEPPVIRMFAGYVSALTFVDSSGALWPIENFSVGHEKMFEVKRMDADKNGERGSILSVVPMGMYAQTNLIVHLKGLNSPIVVTFVSGQKEVDLRTDVRVQAMGPNAQVSVAGLPANTSPILYTLLEGVAPSDSRELKLVGGEGRAWLGKNGKMYLRTPEKVISPNWSGSTRSADGMNAYEMTPANSIRVLQDGRIQTISVEGW